jgi:pyrroline-5-carboxylate reductase
MTVFGFIGTGHLGSMLIRKFVETGAIKAEGVIASNRTREKVERLAESLGIQIGSNREVAEASDVIFISVRPLDVKEVLKELQDLLTPDKLLISAAVDFPLKDLIPLSPARSARVVPSITSERAKGVSLVALGENTIPEDRDLIFTLFRSIGYPVEVDEKDFEVLADLTSCGPGYIAALMYEFSLVASWKGIPKELAEDLVKRTLEGTAEMLQENDFVGLIACVATKGGITEEGVKVIQSEAAPIFDHMFQATRAKHERVKKLIEEQK